VTSRNWAGGAAGAKSTDDADELRRKSVALGANWIKSPETEAMGWLWGVPTVGVSAASKSINNPSGTLGG
jgi:hypothetical protein